MCGLLIMSNYLGESVAILWCLGTVDLLFG